MAYGVRRARAVPPLSYEAVPSSARLDPKFKGSINFAGNVTDLYAHTSVAGFRRKAKTQAADQRATIMGDVNIVDPFSPSNFAEKIGGPRAAVALTSRAQIASARSDNLLGIYSNPNSSGYLSQQGTTAQINVAATTWKIGDLIVKYNSGSVTAASNNATYSVYFDDPFYLGGAVIYKVVDVTSDLSVLTAALGRLSIGKITLAPGGGGGGGGGGAGCVLLGTHIEGLGCPFTSEEWDNSEWVTIELEGGYELIATPDHPVMTENGKLRMDTLLEDNRVITRSGLKRITRIADAHFPGTRVKVIMEHGHLFWANGILCHNTKAP